MPADFVGVVIPATPVGEPTNLRPDAPGVTRGTAERLVKTLPRTLTHATIVRDVINSHVRTSNFVGEVLQGSGLEVGFVLRDGLMVAKDDFETLNGLIEETEAATTKLVVLISLEPPAELLLAAMRATHPWPGLTKGHGYVLDLKARIAQAT
ncbi:MAG TPA: hypothetical protein VJB98_01400 [Candidatus Paceibacterota bacterium]